MAGLRDRLLAEGWEERFSASGARLEEAADNYRSLGYEVRVEAIGDVGGPEACITCLLAPGVEGPVGVIFTRGQGAAECDEGLYDA